MIIATIVFTVAAVAALIGSGYLLLLSLASFFYRQKNQEKTEAITHFAILVPAHDEEPLIPGLFDSFRALEYPKDMYDVYVVADNCTDSTAEACRQNGGLVYEREDTVNIGKPHALRWLVDHVLNSGKQYDAFVFVDADSVISSNFLSAMDARFQKGSRVIQSHYTVSNAAESSTSALRFAGFELINYVRPLGKHVFGASSGLFGTGMAFDIDIMKSHSWDALSLAEDVEFALKLIGEGVKIEFAPEAKVLSGMPGTLKGSTTQNVRWERGRIQMAKQYGVPYTIRGLLGLNVSKLFAGLDQLVPPLSIAFLSGIVLLVASVFIGGIWPIALAAGVLVSMAGYIFLGLLSAKAPMAVYRAFLFAPWFIMWKVLVYAKALKPGRSTWLKTERQS